mgnify:CR=1 FL=1
MRQDVSPNERKEASKSAAIEAAAGAGAARKLSDRAKRQSDASWMLSPSKNRPSLLAPAANAKEVERLRESNARLLNSLKVSSAVAVELDGAMRTLAIMAGD